MTFKDKYKEELCNTSFSDSFEEDTIRLLKAAQREDDLMSPKRKPLKIAALVIAAMLILSCSAFAIVSLLSASDVAKQLGDQELAVLFENSNFSPQTATGTEYSVTFLGMAPGENIYELDGVEISENRSYAVWAVYRNDGTPLSLINGSPIQVIPVIEDCRPDALFSLGMGGSGTEKDGILYYLFDYTDLEVFAGKKVSLMAFEGMFPTADILSMNEDGEIVYSEGYTGFKGIFELDLDESKADPKAAEELMSQF